MQSLLRFLTARINFKTLSEIPEGRFQCNTNHPKFQTWIGLAQFYGRCFYAFLALATKSLCLFNRNSIKFDDGNVMAHSLN